ncbi:MAG TPA: 50S ribosomal protein L32 [Verrucomicrobiae bacterium]|nr:50S ribosomal protein L32 [Verrucomicrobiae bacterium]
MGVPKRRSSKMRMRIRKAANRWRAPKLTECPQCGAKFLSHRVCPSCGYHRGRQVLTIESAAE